jgi:rhodanese-related sulfurtransferase
MTDTVQAHFCYDDYRDPDAYEIPCVPAATDGDWSEFADLTAENDTDMGKLVITSGDTVVEIEDALQATVLTVCLQSIPDLVDRKHVVVRNFMMYGYIRMDPELPDQLLTGDYVETARFKRAELIPALVGVGRSYLEFLEACRSDDDSNALVADVRAALADAEAALERWDGQ